MIVHGISIKILRIVNGEWGIVNGKRKIVNGE